MWGEQEEHLSVESTDDKEMYSGVVPKVTDRNGRQIDTCVSEYLFTGSE